MFIICVTTVTSLTPLRLLRHKRTKHHWRCWAYTTAVERSSVTLPYSNNVQGKERGTCPVSIAFHFPTTKYIAFCSRRRQDISSRNLSRMNSERGSPFYSNKGRRNGRLYLCCRCSNDVGAIFVSSIDYPRSLQTFLSFTQPLVTQSNKFKGRFLKSANSFLRRYRPEAQWLISSCTTVRTCRKLLFLWAIALEHMLLT